MDNAPVPCATCCLTIEWLHCKLQGSLLRENSRQSTSWANMTDNLYLWIGHVAGVPCSHLRNRSEYVDDNCTISGCCFV